MARTKDLIAVIVTSDVHFEEAVRMIAAAGQGAETIDGEALKEVVCWVSSQEDQAAMNAMVDQDVAYCRIPMHKFPEGEGRNRADVARSVQRLLQELRVRDELHYPFAVVAGGAILLVSVVDFEIIMNIARTQQYMRDQQVPMSPSSSRRDIPAQ